MEPYQQLVIDEKAELDSKLAKLHAFLYGPLYSTLNPAEQGRLCLQFGHMERYSDVLGERIEAFTSTVPVLPGYRVEMTASEVAQPLVRGATSVFSGIGGNA